MRMKPSDRLPLLAALCLVAGFTVPARAGVFDGWQYRSKIQFTGYSKSTTLTNFPALVRLGAATVPGFGYDQFFSGANGDLRFASSDEAQELNYEIEQWDAAGTSFVWVQVPHLINANTFIYAYWGRNGVTAPPCTTNGAVWGSTHLGAWHLNGNAADATSRANHGVNYGTSAGTGITAGGRSFSGTSYIDLPKNLRNLGATNAFAITFWFKSASASSSLQCLMEDGSAHNTDSIYLFANAGAKQMLAHLRNDTGGFVGLDTISVPAIGTDWHALGHVYDGSRIRTYFDGNPIWDTAISGNIASGNTHLMLGRRPNGAYYFAGGMDEVRVERVLRPADWVWACWKNQGFNANFQTYGSAEFLAGAPVIENREPTLITAGAATLIGYLASTGGAPATVSVYWGTTDGGAPTSGLWQATNTWAAGVWNAGDTPSRSVSGLATNGFCYYRFAASSTAGSAWAETSGHFLPGEVWATGGTAYETDAVPGTFTLWRPGLATGEATVVNFALGGTATLGVDSDDIPFNSVTIPVGSSNATVTVAPVYDLFDEGDETVALTVLPGLYAVAAASNAVVTIIDAEALVVTNTSVVSASRRWHDNASWNLGHIPLPGEHVVVTNALTVGQPTALLNSFRLQNAAVTFSNWTTRLWALNVDLQSGSLTVPPAFTNEPAASRVWIVCSNLTLAAAATIETSARGYVRGYGPGSANGASHGGRGSSGNWDLVAPACGSAEAPTLPGSGGKGNGVPTLSGDGGGAVRIDAAGTVTVHGKMNANGGNRVTTHGGGGSGGSIFITCRVLAGSAAGALSATGGTGANFGGAGSGGRIAVVYDGVAQAAATPVNPGISFNVSPGSAGYNQAFAEAGTLYFPDRALLSGTMTTQWGGGFLHIPDFTSWELNALYLTGKIGLQSVTNLVTVNGLTVAAGGVLTLCSVPTNAFSPPDGIRVNVGGDLCVTGTLALCSDELNGASPRVLCRNLAVATGGKIDADYRGFTGLRSGGYSGPGNLIGFTRGAGHGGMGSSGWGRYNNAGPAYDDPMAPNQPGSGGGTYTGISGYGGGVIRLQVGEAATIHGTLTANGQSGIGTHGCGGSGGSIHLSCQTFQGSATGVVQAKGGNGDNYQAGAGAGGRIAVVYDPVLQAARPQPNPGVTFSVAPGSGGQFPHLAETGTLYLPDAGALFLSTNMTAQWQDVNFHIPGGMTHWSLPSLCVAGKFRIPGLETMSVSGDVTLASGGRLALYSHPVNTVSEEIGFRLDVGGALTVASGAEIVFASDLATGASPLITCGRFDLQSGGLVQTDFRGWDMNLGAGRGISRAGGGYGGAGSRGDDGLANAGPSNGVAYAPIWPGSGAGNFDSSGGRGAGLVRISAAGAMTVNGTIRADGMARKSETHAGGGSGGGILLTAGKFAGSGTLQANGGICGNTGGAGGGGRICVWTPALTPESLRTLAGKALPRHAEVLAPAAICPALTLNVAPGTGGSNPAEAKSGTVFFGRLIAGSLLVLR